MTEKKKERKDSVRSGPERHAIKSVVPKGVIIMKFHGLDAVTAL